MAGSVERRDEVSPELVLVDPELRLRLRLCLAAEEERLAPPPRRRGVLVRWVGPACALFVVMYGLAFAFARMPEAVGAPPPRALEPIDTSALPTAAPAPKPEPAAVPRRRPPDVGEAPLPALRKPAAARQRPLFSETEPASDLLGPLPSPTPPALRLRPTAARALLDVARRHQVDWASLLAEVRPWRQVRPPELESAARHLDLSPREAAIATYARAVGLDVLVSGLSSARSLLGARVLRDPRIQIYQAGRGDIATGRVDVRVLVLLLYLARTEGSVAVSSLVSGHESPEGSRSAHVFGAAVDLRAFGGVAVLGHERRVERAIRDMLLLPEEVRPRQIISSLDLGGPTLALANHDRFVHVGFDPTVGSGLELLWRTAGAAYNVPWSLLGAINEIETNNGTFLKVSPAGAVGWMQFMPSTWARYGVDADGNGTADPWNPTDAVFAAARYLTAAGVQYDQYRGVWAYNHAGWYVNDVLSRARRIEAQ